MPEFSDPLSFLLEAPERAVLAEILTAYQYDFVFCRFFRNRAPWRLAWRTCSDHFFLFPVTGRLHVELEGESYELEPGHFLMLPEETPHRLEIGEGAARLHQISLHAQIHDRWGRPLLARCAATRGRLMHGRHDLEALRRMTHLYWEEREAAAAFAEAFLKQLLAFQLQAGAAFEPIAAEPGLDRRVLHAIGRMEKEYGCPGLNVEALAEEAGITSTRFRALFRGDTGVGPKEYLTRLRLRQARLLLSRTARTIKEVAAACGFGSDHYFHLAFRRACGSTPSEYRRRRHSEV